MAASNRDLEADCQSGRFRQDLYFRLNGLTLCIPPLRRRPLDIEPLARRLLADACRLIERSELPRISPEAIACLRCHAWPGNVRELRNAMERAAVLCHEDTLLPEHLPPSIANRSRLASPPSPPDGLSATVASDRSAREASPRDLPAEIRELERARIMEALVQCGGIQSEAARMLRISRGTLIARMNRYGVPRPRKREGSPLP
jgi:DNA-binding NtrC family response regulator